MSLEITGTVVPYEVELGVLSSDLLVSSCSPVFTASIKRLHKYSPLLEIKVKHNGDVSTGEQTLNEIKPFFTNSIDGQNPSARDADLAFYEKKDERSLTYIKKHHIVFVGANSLPCKFKPGEVKSFYPKIEQYPGGSSNADFIGFELSSDCQTFRVVSNTHLLIRARLSSGSSSFFKRCLFDKIKDGDLFIRSFQMFYYGFKEGTVGSEIISGGISLVSGLGNVTVEDIVVKEEIPISTTFLNVVNEVAQSNFSSISFPFFFPQSTLGFDRSVNFQFNPNPPISFQENQDIERYSVLIRVGYSYTNSGNIIYEDFYT